jgi:hypothetical protein
MEPVGEPVDHGHRRVAREADGELVVEGADHDSIDVAGEDARHVLHRLARSDPDLPVGDEDRAPAELGHRNLEGEAGPEARLVEDEREGLLRHLLMAAPRAEIGLEARRDREQAVDVGAREIGEREKVPLHASSLPVVEEMSSGVTRADAPARRPP